jgi:16S rRNA (cytosine967-C5)-methyltransferase
MTYDSLKPELKPDSLAYALSGAAQAVAAVRSGTALPQALNQIAGKMRATPQARGAMQDISYRTMRHLGRADTLITAMTSKQPEPALLHALLCCALALISDPAERTEDMPYNAFTVVDQAVTAASVDPSIAHAKGMVNAVLRRFLRERDTLLAQVLRNPVAQWNYPAWWIDATKSAYPSNWQALLAAGNAQPPLTLRVNLRKTDVAAYLQMLTDNGLTATQIGPQAIRLTNAMPVQQIPGFADGLASVQDAAAQLAATLLDLQDGMRVLDACAAPGGKTCHMLECADVDMLAIDSDTSRLTRITENLQRLQLQAQLKTGDAAARGWWDGQEAFDRILADVPCTASGIVRRHPDIRWLRRKGDSAQLARLAQQILDNLWSMLKPGGKLLFVTCSYWPQESEAQAAAFVSRTKAIRLPAPGQLQPANNTEQDQDALFYALFEKPAS